MVAVLFYSAFAMRDMLLQIFPVLLEPLKAFIKTRQSLDFVLFQGFDRNQRYQTHQRPRF